ncbi:hypothetical protein CDAR_85221 [Caerostris darwini]|uniref:Uncharacterized protein n=1 Tax=Caerostris darwini TaxID=1538125 RepID=A0AAV4MZB8_9ARAC|nr:hypothetical protein CDAR_85221 [Caerostris darwini]
MSESKTPSSPNDKTKITEQGGEGGIDGTSPLLAPSQSKNMTRLSLFGSESSNGPQQSFPHSLACRVIRTLDFRKCLFLSSRQRRSHKNCQQRKDWIISRPAFFFPCLLRR